MKFIQQKIWEEAADSLADTLNNALSENKVLWLLSGGSNVKVSVKVMTKINEEKSQNLSVMLVDERYGAPGHSDSNWQQLVNEGFDFKHSKQLPVLKDGESFEQSIENYNQTAMDAFSNNDYIICQLGMGADGHIAGILPNSSACDEEDNFVAGYDAPPYKRMTLTFKALKQSSVIFVLAFGANKVNALTLLRDDLLPLKQQPAQILKEMPEVYIYNDQIGDNDG